MVFKLTDGEAAGGSNTQVINVGDVITTYSEGIREQLFQLTHQFCLQSGDDEFTIERDGVEIRTETIILSYQDSNPRHVSAPASRRNSVS